MRRILFLVLASAVFAACSAGSASKGPGDGDSTGDGDSPGDGDLGDGDLDLSGSGGIASSTGGQDGGEPTTIDGTIGDDRGGILNLVGTPEVVNFTLTLPDGTIAEGLIWSVDDTRIGSITTDGVFTAKGMVGGVVKVTATLGNASLTTEFTVNVDMTRNVGSLDQPTQEALLAAVDQPAPGFEFLYPYTGTVFPRGIEPPLLQLEAPGTDKAMVEINAAHFHYVQFSNSKLTTHFQIDLPPDIWEALSLSALGTEEVEVSVTKSSGGTAKERWIFAPASIKGIIFYSTYNSQLNAGQPAIMRVRPGTNAEVLQTGCTACHTVSSNGTVLAAAYEGFPAAGETGLNQWNPENSFSVNLDQQGNSSARYTAPDGRTLAFAGLTPDGELALTNGLPPIEQTPEEDPVAGIPPYMPHGVQSVEGIASRLVNTSTGAVVSAPSLANIVTYALSPSFAPDATKVTFINGDVQGAKTLWTADFDPSQSPPVFSNGAQAASSTKVLAWPSFLPDSQAVIYHEGDSFDSAGFEGDFAPVKQLFAEIRMVELADGTVKSLNALNGRDASGTSYLPYGEAEENDMNYEPNVIPVAIGGYYWVLFTSRRAYGNDIAPSGAIAADDPFGNWGPQAGTPRKKLWVAAIDVNHDGADPSHPAFYLGGQERASGNMRAFTALEPCRADGASCESGSDCCNGFCRETSRGADGAPVLECVPPPEGECSQIDELCFTAANCCDPAATCVNNRCAIGTPTVVK